MSIADLENRIPETCQAVRPYTVFHPDTSNSETTQTCTGTSIDSGSRRSRKKPRQSYGRELPPIGVYWDIENCQVPKDKSALSVVQRIRECFFYGYRQVEFVVVCDVVKENTNILADLHSAQVNVLHVSSICKNAADDKLRQSLRHFGNTYNSPATVVLISGDVNFASDISDLRYRKQIRIVLIHNFNVSYALKEYAHEAYLFHDLTDNLPAIDVTEYEPVELYISNLPLNYYKNPVRTRLRFLSDNCGGRVINMCPLSGTAIMRFASLALAVRAQRRLNGEDVFGRKIVATGTDQMNSMLNNHARQATGGNQSQPSTSWQNLSSIRDWRSPSNRTMDSQQNYSSSDRSNSALANPVELIITNLDASMRDLRKQLCQELKLHTSMYQLTINYNEAKPTAVVKVPNQQDAEYVISKMHRQKVGFRRILISYARQNGTDDEELRERIVYLLQESPTHSIPLYLLLATLESKYMMRVSLFEINKLRDVCQIVDNNGERLVALNAEVLAAVPANLQKPQQMHYCCVHCPNGITDITLWQPDIYQPPCVNMALKEFGQRLNKMLASHMGTLPLLSFMICYSHEFNEPLLVDSVNGVPLEHLVTCVKNIKLKYESTKNKAKYIVWETYNESEKQYNDSPLAQSISLLRREFVDLLRNEPKCQIPLGKFVPAYHHHFGRQLRVADYGYTKLDDLLHSPNLSNVVQILGEGAIRVLTLTHSAQMRRFTSDLLRMIKSQKSKLLTLSEFKDVYFRVFHKTFTAYDYGVCTVEDLLEDVPENILMLNKTDQDVTIGIPQRVRTADEILHTKQFAEDVVKLLAHSPDNSMLFDKFVPHYHHHFGYQCKVSDYGFTKLIELFEAIPEIVKIEELPNSQRKICLSEEQSLNLLGNRILELIKKSHVSYMPLDQLGQAYMHEFKAPINLQLYKCTDLTQVVEKLEDFLAISYSNAGQVIIPAQKSAYTSIELRVWSLLVTPPHHQDAYKLILAYYMRFHNTITIAQLEQLNNVMMTHTTASEYTVFLVPGQVKAAKFYQLLLANHGQLPFANLESWFKREFPELGDEGAYEKFLTDNSHLYVLTRSRKKTSVSLHPKLAELKLAITIEQNTTEPVATQSSFVWPLSASQGQAVVPYEQQLGTRTRNSPPKPDTPPPINVNSLLSWQQQLTPTRTDMEFSISMPTPETPQYLPNPFTLISPAKNLLPACPMGSMITFPCAPKGTELPIPDKLLKRAIFPDDSGDSGVNNSHFASDNEMDSTYEQLGARPKYPRNTPAFNYQI